MATFANGTFDNEGTFRFQGAFPGVELAWGPNVTVADYGDGQLDLTVPQWLEDFASSTTATNLAIGAKARSALGELMRDAIALAVDDLVLGECANVPLTLGGLALSASVCTAVDGNGDSAVSIGVSAGATMTYGSTSTIAGLGIDLGGMVIYPVGVPRCRSTIWAGLRSAPVARRPRRTSGSPGACAWRPRPAPPTPSVPACRR